MKAIFCTTVTFLSIWPLFSPTLAATPGIELLLIEKLCLDDDGDGYGASGSEECIHDELDCDDTNPNVNPDVVESKDAGNCADGLDNDCDGLTDADPECQGCFISVVM